MPRVVKESSARSRWRTQPSTPNSTSDDTAHFMRGNLFCVDCDKEFSRPSDLKRHLEQTIIHNPNAKRFECRYCGSLHTQKANLKTHERIHLNKRKEHCGLPRPFHSSEKCSFSCSDPSSMTRHISNIHFSPFTSMNLPVPDWLLEALSKRNVARETVPRTALDNTGIRSSNSPTPPLTCSSGPISPIPLPFIGGGSPVAKGMAKKNVLDKKKISKPSRTKIYIAQEPDTTGLSDFGSFHFDKNFREEYMQDYPPCLTEQAVTPTALFSQHEAATQYDQSTASPRLRPANFKNAHGLSLEPSVLEDIISFIPGSSVNNAAAFTPDDSTWGLMTGSATDGIYSSPFDSILSPLGSLPDFGEEV